jgi:hypothetical protein
VISAGDIGTAWIRVVAVGDADSVRIVVIPPVAAIDLPDADTIVAGTDITLTATLRDSDDNVLTGRSVSWTTSNALVATVSTTGIVSGVGAGQATITASTEGVQAQTLVTVAPVITVGPELPSLFTGDTITLSVTFARTNGTPIDVTPVSWQSANEAIATVDANGVVSALQPGLVTLQAAAFGGSDSIVVAVIDGSPRPNTLIGYLRRRNADTVYARVFDIRDSSSSRAGGSAGVVEVDGLDWTRDGRLAIAYVGSSASLGIWVQEVGGTTNVQVSPNGIRPVWSADGSRIAYRAPFGGEIDVYTVIPGQAPVRLTVTPGNDVDPSFSPDGRRIAFVRNGRELRVIRPDGTGERQVHAVPAGEAVGNPLWSPDGRWIAFGGTRGLWLVRPDGSEAHPISANCSAGGCTFMGTPPVPYYWSSDALRIFYSYPNGLTETTLSSGAHRLIPVPGICANPRLSPDNQLIAATCTDVTHPDTWPALFVMNLDGSNFRQLTFGEHADKPAWVP